MVNDVKSNLAVLIFIWYTTCEVEKMQHKMKLLEEPFNDILSGNKNIEFRLFDDKRRKIKIGDTIEFSKLPDLKEKLDVEVIDLYQYQTFRELFSFLGYEGAKLDETVAGMYTIYTPQQEQDNGVLGIKIKKLEK